MSGEYQTDGYTNPWVLDLDGRWHVRPPSDEWVLGDDGFQAKTVCGEAVPSVHVSGYRPEPAADLGEFWCMACEHADKCEGGCDDPVTVVGWDPDGTPLPMCAGCAAATVAEA